MNQLFNMLNVDACRVKYTHHDRLMDEPERYEREWDEEDDNAIKYEPWLAIT